MPFRNIVLVILLITRPISTFCQSVINGNVTDTIGNPIQHSQVIVYFQSNGRIFAYTLTDNLGYYKLNISKPGSYRIEYRALGFISESRILEVPADSSQNTVSELNVKLKTSIYDIKEVIKQGERPISFKKDTVVYNVIAFSNGTERVVEDVLRKLPGINVDDNGRITFKGKEVEKVMVEGDDFFGKSYRAITQNVNANAIERVEAISNYNENPLLKEIANSEKVALNLKLSKNAYTKIYGAVNLGYNTSNDHDTRVNLMNFNRSVRSLFIGNSNSIGFNPIGDSYDLTKSLSDYSLLNDYGIELPNFILNLEGYRPQLKRQNVSSLQNRMGSLNEALTLNSRTKLTVTSAFNRQIDNFVRNTIQNYSFDSIGFTNNESYSFNHRNTSAFIKAKIDSRTNESSYIQYNLNFSGVFGEKNVNKSFNGINVFEVLPNKSTLINSNFSYTKRISSRNVFQILGLGYISNSREKFTVYPLPISSAFPYWYSFSSANQLLSTKAHLAMGVINHKYRISDLLLLESEAGMNTTNYKVDAEFKLIDSTSMEHIDNDLSGNMKYQSSTAFTKINLTIGYDSLKLNVGISGGLFNYRKQSEGFADQHAFVFPSATFSWQINRINRIDIAYNSRNENVPINQIINRYYLTSHNSIQKGLSHLDFLTNHFTTLKYTLGKWDTRFFLNGIVGYSYQPKYISQNTAITSTLIVSNDTIVSGRQTFNASIDVNYFISPIRTNIKLVYTDFLYDYSSYVNGIPNKYKSNSKMTGVEFRSSFRSAFNFHFGYSYIQGAIVGRSSKASSHQRIFCNLYLKANDRLNAELHSELYGNQDTPLGLKDRSYLFVNANLIYKFKDTGWSVSAQAFNLFNRKTYNTYQINEFYKSNTYYSLIPRYLMLSVSFRL